MGIDFERRRARWRRNKQAERARKKQKRREPSPKFVDAVFAERDRRASLQSASSYTFRHPSFTKEGTWERAIRFTADVWAASMLVEAEFGIGEATPTRIKGKLQQLGWTHDYSDQSLRKMIYRARERIETLETTGHLMSPGTKLWEPFDPESGSD